MSIVMPTLDPRSAQDPMLPRPAVIQAIKSEAYGISTFSMAFVDPAETAAYRFFPGQFNMLYLPGVGEVAMVWALRTSTAFLNSASLVIPLTKSNLLFCQLSKP